MEKIMTRILIAIVGSSGIWAVILAIIQRRWKKKDEDKINPKQFELLIHSQKLLLADRIRYLGTWYIYKGDITLDDKGNLHDMFEVYQSLDGKQDHLDVIIDEVNNLKIVEAHNIHPDAQHPTITKV